MRLLLIEDNTSIADSIKEFLSSHYIVDVRPDGTTGEYTAFVNTYDVIIIDYMLPDISGVEVCTRIRNAEIHTPILFLTGRDRVKDKVDAFKSGADDYLTKPFSPQELLARVRSLLRRNDQDIVSNTLNISGLSIDTDLRNVFVFDEKIHLSKKEFDLLEYLARNRNRILSRSMILEHVWEKGLEEYSNTVDVHIKYLRDKIDRAYNTEFIKTVHGVGYTLQNNQWQIDIEKSKGGERT